MATELMRDYHLQHKLQRLIDEAAYSSRMKLRSLSACNKYPLYAASNEVLINVYEHANHERSAKFIGLSCCRSVWACPVCMGRKIAEYVDKITQLIDFHRERGYDAYMVTFTIPHYRQQTAAEVINNLKQAQRKFSQASRHDRKALGILGTITATECKYSDFNGWHFHNHVLYFVQREHSQEFTSEAFEQKFLDRWLSIIKPLYLHSSKPVHKALHISKTPILNGEYLAKELSKCNSSKATQAKHAAQWDTLELLESDDPRRNKLYIEFAEAVHGHTRIRIGYTLLKGFFFAPTPPKADNPYEVISVETVASFTFTEWNNIVEQERDTGIAHRLNLLHAAIEADLDGVLLYCYDHGLPLPHEPTRKTFQCVQRRCCAHAF